MQQIEHGLWQYIYIYIYIYRYIYIHIYIYIIPSTSIKPKSFLPPTLHLCRWVPALLLYFPPWPCMAPIPRTRLACPPPRPPRPLALCCSPLWGVPPLSLLHGRAVPFYINSSMCTPRLSRFSWYSTRGWEWSCWKMWPGLWKAIVGKFLSLISCCLLCDQLYLFGDGEWMRWTVKITSAPKTDPELCCEVPCRGLRQSEYIVVLYLHPHALPQSGSSLQQCCKSNASVFVTTCNDVL